MSRAPLRYHQPFHLIARVFLAVGACIPLLGFYELLIRPRMPWLQWGMLPILIVGFLALGVGLFFLSVAVFSGSRTVTIDRKRRACVIGYDGTFGLHWEFVHPFATLDAPRAVELASSDGPRNWGVVLPRKQGKQLVVDSHSYEARAKAEADAIAAYMAGR